MDVAIFFFFHLLYLKISSRLPPCPCYANAHTELTSRAATSSKASKLSFYSRLALVVISQVPSLRTQQNSLSQFLGECQQCSGFFWVLALVFFLWEGFVLAGGEKSRGILMWCETSVFLASVNKINQAFSTCVCAWLYVILHTKSRFARRESQRLLMQHFVNGKTFIKPTQGNKKQTQKPTS